MASQIGKERNEDQSIMAARMKPWMGACFRDL